MEPERRRFWRQRLSGVEELPALHPTLLWEVALPLLDRLAGTGAGGPAAAGNGPLIALNGPVGAGKSSLARTLRRLAPLLGLELAVASIDDLYLPWQERCRRLAGNPFGVQRVPPGSHDVDLLLQRLGEWRRSGLLRLPRFDKTLAGGRGDRAGWRQSRPSALLLEGWLMGCRPLGRDRLRGRMASGDGVEQLTAAERSWLPRWDEELQAYLPLWQACDGLWVLQPRNWSLPRRWRLQAEARQRRGGGGWLDAGAIDRIVRASLHSLPPALYQDPLTRPGGTIPLERVVRLDGRRRCELVECGSPPCGRSDHSSPSSLSSAIG